MHKFLRSTLLIAAVLCAIPSAKAYTVVNSDGSINVGNFNLFTVLTSGDLNDTNNTETGPSIITGNLGIGGKGNFSMSDGQLNGDLYMNNFGTVSIGGPSVFTGHSHGKRTDQGEDGVDQTNTLNKALADAASLSAAAAALAPSNSSAYTVSQGSFTQGQSVSINNPNADITISDRAPFGHTIVLSINNFVLNNGTFTLSGTANTTYVLNISGQFNINNSTVVTTGGLLASHVLFNFTGSQASAGTITMQQGTSLTGVVLATNRQVDLSGGKIFGRLVAEQLTLTSGGQVISQ